MNNTIKAIGITVLFFALVYGAVVGSTWLYSHYPNFWLNVLTGVAFLLIFAVVYDIVKDFLDS